VDADADRFPDVMRAMTWEQVGEMADAGVDFGSHTLTHPSLPGCDPAQLELELEGSREPLARRLGRCDSIAYPFGHWDARVATATAKAGYRSAFTLPAGHQRTVTPLSIPRVAVDHRDDRRRFSAKLNPLGRRVLLSPAHTILRAVRASFPR
jgi:peptidoglycan/xylan/chitin deacetylase (PgdA/CDA1 family)